MTEEEKYRLRNKYGITKEDEEGYVMPEEKDYEALEKIKKIESRKLTDEDKEMVRFIRTQLEDDWRKPLLDKLNELLSKY